jgi:hypothetical protein
MRARGGRRRERRERADRPAAIVGAQRDDVGGRRGADADPIGLGGPVGDVRERFDIERVERRGLRRQLMGQHAEGGLDDGGVGRRSGGRRDLGARRLVAALD